MPDSPSWKLLRIADPLLRVRARGGSSSSGFGDAICASLGAVAVSLALAGCAGSRSEDHGGVGPSRRASATLATTRRVSPAEVGAGSEHDCDDWPFSETDRRALAAQAIAFLEALYPTRPSGPNAKWTLDDVKRDYPRGLVLVDITHDEDEWLTKQALFGAALVEWLNGRHDTWPFPEGARESPRLGERDVKVGARWGARGEESGREHLCVGDTEGTEGMFPGKVWVLFSATDEEMALGHQDGVVVLFDGDPRRGFRVSGLVKPHHGI